MDETGSPLVGLFVLLVLLFLYLIPWFVAKARNHRDSLAFFWCNVLLGWTLLGWTVSLIWACLDRQREQVTR